MTLANELFGSYYQYMQNALDGLATQQKAVANNLANADNPNYHPVTANFQDQLQSELDSQNSNSNLQVHLDFDPEFQGTASQTAFSPQLVSEPSNRVDLNYENAQLAKTQILYNLAADGIKPSWAKYVIENFAR